MITFYYNTNQGNIIHWNRFSPMKMVRMRTQFMRLSQQEMRLQREITGTCPFFRQFGKVAIHFDIGLLM